MPKRAHERGLVTKNNSVVCHYIPGLSARVLVTLKAKHQSREIKVVSGTVRSSRPNRNFNYFVKHVLHKQRMEYSLSWTHHMPIGSGAIESAVCRVINLRVKSTAVYWLRENAETMIRMRAWIKAGRAEDLFQQTTCVTPQLAL